MEDETLVSVENEVVTPLPATREYKNIVPVVAEVGTNISAKEFFAMHGICQFDKAVAISKENKIPLITFRDKDKKTLTVLFSVNAGKTVIGGESVSVPFLSKYSFTYSESLAGILQWKISTGDSRYQSFDMDEFDEL